MIAATHDAVFHADDVFAGALVRLIDPLARLVRTRDAAQPAAATIRFDVGGKSAPATGDYDHHQRGGAGVRPNGIPYAAFGLLWRQFGAALCDGDQAVADTVDTMLAQQIDAADNGVQIAQSLMPDVFPVTIRDLVIWLNPSWDEDQDFDGRYEDAVALFGALLRRAIVQARCKVPAQSLVAGAIAEATDPRIIILDRFVPWQEALIGAGQEALFIVYPSKSTWRCQAVPKVLGEPGARLPLPEAWAGLDSAAPAGVTGVVDATFCHRGRFICGAQSRDGALELARLAVKEAP